ncbi:MAG TPA: alpha/beta hydrolase [Rheinheimera sp.]|uniref:alpha/beta fold hydrolase n=1 Tax=Rheinheimera sp. TaxID=1869214 RepID=UPI002F9525DF
MSNSNNNRKKQPGFWTYFAISMSIVIAVMAANFSAKAQTPHDSFTVEVIGSGKPVLMIPGLMSDARVWRPTAATLADNYQLHLISLAGFAGTPAVDGEHLPKVKQQLLQYIDQQQLQRPAVVGHSLGAFMAFYLASSNPEKIGTVVAVDGLPYLAPVFSGNNNVTVDQVKPQADDFRQQYRNMTAEQLAAITAQGIGRQAISAQHQQQVIAMAKASDASVVGQALYELLTTDLRQDVGKITSKVVLLGASGALADDTARDNARQLYQQQVANIAKATVNFNPAARHFIMLDDPKWLTAQILSALQE